MVPILLPPPQTQCAKCWVNIRISSCKCEIALLQRKYTHCTGMNRNHHVRVQISNIYGENGRVYHIVGMEHQKAEFVYFK